MSEPWYQTAAAEERLTQGDLIFECPVVGWRDGAVKLEGTEEGEILKGVADAFKADVVVMTQACDLAHEKVANVILCPHLALEDYRAVWEAEMKRVGQNPNSKAWKKICDDIRDGFVWNLSILNHYDGEGVSISHRVVDFHNVYSVPRAFLESLLLQRATPRFRLLPPYREHLSQAFARFFMRVGLPVPVTEAW
jgi:hypothetical protein